MNVLLVNNCPPYTGTGVYTFLLYSALQKLDGGIKLLSWENKLLEQINYITRNHDWLAYLHEPPRALSQLFFTLRIPKTYALYHITTANFSMAFWRLRPCVITVHDLIPFTSPRWAGDLLIRKSMGGLTKAKRLICVSNYTKDELIRFFNIDPGIVRVIHDGLDHNLFKPRDKADCRKILGLGEDRALVLHVGSEEPRKNIPTLIKAFYTFQKETPNAVLIRVGEKTPDMQRLINSLGLGDKVLYYKGVENLGHFYSAADLFVFPSWLEGFGIPPIEAMASGCPVIASNKTSIPEVAGDAGILLDPFDVDGFAYWMGKVYSDEPLKAKLTEEGLKRSKMFSWERCARETLEVYQDVLRGA